jgi:hypothetical protein
MMIKSLLQSDRVPDLPKIQIQVPDRHQQHEHGSVDTSVDHIDVGEHRQAPPKAGRVSGGDGWLWRRVICQDFDDCAVSSESCAAPGLAE